MKRANSTDAAKIREALAATGSFNSVSGDMSLNETHDAVRGVVIIELKDGKQVYKETIHHPIVTTQFVKKKRRLYL